MDPELSRIQQLRKFQIQHFSEQIFCYNSDVCYVHDMLYIFLYIQNFYVLDGHHDCENYVHLILLMAFGCELSGIGIGSS